MSFPATGLYVLIASPSDTREIRAVARRAIEEWNELNAEPYGVVLVPLMWETTATPELGDRPQGIINRQLVSQADVLVGIFWTRLGSATGVAESGTVEEIEHFMATKQPVLLYFSKEPVVPGTIDVEQFARLNTFKTKLRSAGLTGDYESATDFGNKLQNDLTRTIRRLIEHGFVATAEHRAAAGTPGQVTTESVVHQYKRRLRDIVTRYEAEWKTLTDGLNVDSARRLMARLAQELSELVRALSADLDVDGREPYTSLVVAMQLASQLSRHRFYMDGGVSWNDFVTGVQRVFDNLTAIIGLDW